jgi:hypothetical protein
MNGLEIKRPRELLFSLFPDLSAHTFAELKGRERYESFRFYAYSNSKDTHRCANRTSVTTVNLKGAKDSQICCGMCGSTNADTLLSHSCIPVSVTFFCSDKNCLDQYRYCAINYHDLTYGIPHLWKVYAQNNPRLYRSYDEDINPSCAYCNEKDESIVVYHPLMLSWFQHNAFCRNSTCCKQYIFFVENIPRIPHVFELMYTSLPS